MAEYNNKSVSQYNRTMTSRKKYKRNYSLSFMLILFIAVIVFFILSVTVFFNIEEVRIVGSSIYTAEEIIDSSALRAGDNMIRTNMGKCEKTICDKLVYIENAKVKRIFPNTIEIDVSPSIEASLLSYGNEFFLTSKQGKILNILDTPKDGLVEIDGVEPLEDLSIGDTFQSADESKTKIIDEISQYDFEESGMNVNNFDISDKLNISCMYENRIKIEIGVMTEFDYKLKFANEIINNKLGESTEGTLKMLSDGQASFLDKLSIEDNDTVYNNNISLKNDAVFTNEVTDSQTASDTGQTSTTME